MKRAKEALGIPRKRRLSEPPTIEEVKSGKYDQDFLLEDYKRIFVGCSTDDQVRHRGSSGGVGSELLKWLLETDEVDGVIAVGMNPDRPWMPQYRLVEKPHEVLELAGSKYVYMKFKEIDSILSQTKGRKLAVVVQPCHSIILSKLRETRYPQIRYVFSFFCGYNIGLDATNYLIKKAGFQTSEVSEIEYRGGNYPGGFRVVNTSGEVRQFGKESYELVDLLFLLPGCERCPLYMGEGADVVLGDAWLKDYSNLTAVIGRTEVGLDLLKQANQAERILLYNFQEQDLVNMHWHNLRFKKYGHSKLLHWITRIFNNHVAIYWAPFRLLSWISRIRRKFKIGITVEQLKSVQWD